MKKIYEFIDNKEKTLKLLDSFLFFSDEWMFVDDIEFIGDDIVGIIPIEIFIDLGQKLADNLNKINLDVLDYDVDKIEEYLNY